MGPLAGIRIIELAGIGPGPFCGMLLSDLGAEVIRVDRASWAREADRSQPPSDLLNRGRRSIAVDMKSQTGLEAVLRLTDEADALFEGFRPGVCERLGIGPDVCLERNPRLVYGRMTGWGQDGPYEQMAGHDINYIALSGALHTIGRKGELPLPPLNLVGDVGGGGLLLAYGMLAALLEAQRTGKGQVVDRAMVDGAAILMTMFYGMQAAGRWHPERGTNRLDTGSHFYDVYETADAKYVSVGSMEPQFYAELVRLTGLGENGSLPDQLDEKQWPAMKERLTQIFKSKTRAEWEAIMEGTDTCFAPVLSMEEAPQHPHALHRKAFVDVAGVTQPAPAPRFSRTECAVQGPPVHPGEHTDSILRDAGFSAEEISALRVEGAVA
jgi:alpha-methylacyl-CoA racemase